MWCVFNVINKSVQCGGGRGVVMQCVVLSCADTNSWKQLIIISWFPPRNKPNK